jgi:hypothetical protein
MQSFISNGCVKKYYLYIVLIMKDIRCINIIQEMELHTKKCHKSIDVDFRKNQKQISSNLDDGWRRKRDTKFDCRLKGEKQTDLHSIRPGPTPSFATMVSLPGSPLSVRQTTVIFFYIGFWNWRVGPTLFFLNWNLLPSNIIPHKHHQKNRIKYE